VTISGESMMRIKATVICGTTTERNWRNKRAQSLARMIAWHRRARSDYARRIILEDIIPDIGWPRLSWLKPVVRRHGAEIRDSLGEAARDGGRG
jgi:hypothetical protein